MLDAELRDRCLRLSRTQRIQLRGYLTRSLQEEEKHPSNRYYKLLDLCSEILGYETIRDDMRTRACTNSRKAVVAKLYDEGYNGRDIADMSGRTLQTILWYRKEAEKAISHPWSNKGLVHIYNELKSIK